MPDDSIAERLPPFVIAAILAVSLIVVLFLSAATGRRAALKGGTPRLGSLETMASGLLGLLLAFNFSVAQSRFDARQELIVREADAIGTAYLRCSVLAEEDRAECRDGLHHYAQLRITAYEAYGRSGDHAEFRSALAGGERIQTELWTLASRTTRAAPTAANAIFMMALNDVIDRDSDRRAAVRIQVPTAVSLALVFSCLAWAVLLGRASGAEGARAPAAWVVVALLISVVFGVALDLDRPRTGFVTTRAAEQSMNAVLRATSGAHD